MANRKKQGNFARFKKQLYRVAVAATILALGAGTCTAIVRAVSCSSVSECNDKISKLSDANSKSQSRIDDLQVEATNYNDAIGRLKQQIAAIQSSINDNEAKQAELQKKISALQDQIAAEKLVLGDVIRTMYVDGDMSNIEMLASSQNLSDYVNKQEYRSVVQSKIQSTLAQITVLQDQVKAQKAHVDELLKDLSAQRQQLDAAKAEQDKLLAYNQAQQASFDAKIKSNKSKIDQLQRQQAAIIAANSRSVSIAPSSGRGGNCDNGEGNGGYPTYLCNAGKDAITGPGGFPNRECTSYAYWYFTSVEGKSLSVWGNANQWVYTSSRGTTSTPHVGDIGVLTAGQWGHVVIVDALPGQSFGGQTVPAGYVMTQSMNYDFAGHFHYAEYPISSLSYIH